MMLDLRAVPMDDPVIIVAAVLMLAFAVFVNVVVGPKPDAQGSPIETQRGQGRFHIVAYGIVGLVVLLALGVI